MQIRVEKRVTNDVEGIEEEEAYEYGKCRTRDGLEEWGDEWMGLAGELEENGDEDERESDEMRKKEKLRTKRRCGRCVEGIDALGAKRQKCETTKWHLRAQLFFDFIHNDKTARAVPLSKCHLPLDPSHHIMSPSHPFTHPLLPGLSLHSDFLPLSHHSLLLDTLPTLPWKHLRTRSLQNHGGLPHVKGMLPTPIPTLFHPLLSLLSPFFPSAPNHILVNRYQPSQGISPHVDGPAYKPIAAIISLSSPLVMDFHTSPPPTDSTTPHASLLLRPRSLLLLTGSSYTDLHHGISARAVDEINATVLNAQPEEYGALTRQERISLTVRTACKTLRNPLLGRSKNKF